MFNRSSYIRSLLFKYYVMKLIIKKFTSTTAMITQLIKIRLSGN